jgi:hypothetical protein
MTRTALALAILLGAPPAAQAQDGVALLREINAAHRGRWWTTLTFVQRTTWPGTPRPEETWYETMHRPGLLRIDIERRDSIVGGILFRNDSIYQWGAGGAPQGQPRAMVHPLMVLLHDIHVGSVDAQVAKLRGLGFDLGKRHRGSWQGHPVEIVGALAGDSTSAQFWVDPSRLVVVRIIQSSPNGARTDIHIGKFSEGGPGLVEREIDFFANGNPGLKEEYTWIRTGVTIPEAVFVPGNTALPAWVTEYKRQ